MILFSPATFQRDITDKYCVINGVKSDHTDEVVMDCNDVIHHDPYTDEIKVGGHLCLTA